MRIPRLPDFNEFVARAGIRLNSGATTYWRQRLNLIPSSDLTITLTDDPTDEEVDVAISIAGGLVPAGTILMYGSTSAPTGYLLCNGASVLRADYAALFTAIGTTFGAVDGTHFTLPDFRDRFPTGSGSTYSIAGTGGEATHALSSAELAAHTHDLANHTHGLNSHTHSLSAHTHTHGHTHDMSSHTHAIASGYSVVTGGGSDIASGSGYAIGSPASQANSPANTGGTSVTNSSTPSTDSTGAPGTGTSGNTSTATPSTNTSGSTGSGTAHENRPPYLGIPFIIKT